MVGRLDLQNGDDPLDTHRKEERMLDSPDSGLPPSPSPTSWFLPHIDGERDSISPGSEYGCSEIAGPAVPASLTRFHWLSYGEGISLEPIPPTEVRYTSTVHYASDRHFIQVVYLQPRGLVMESYKETVVVLTGSTRRRYRTDLELQPRQRPQRYTSTTIIFPKHPRAVCATELHHHGSKSVCRFLSSVELEAREGGPAAW